VRDGSASIAMSARIVGHHVSVVLHHCFGPYLTHKDSERLCGERMLAPPTSSQPLPGGSGATVGTLRTGYPRIQALSQDNGSRLPTKGSSEATMCPRGSGSRSRLGAAPGLPCAPAAGDSTGVATCPRGSRHLWGRHVSPGLYGLQANKQISPGDPTIMISIGAGTRISSNALRYKGCSARSQGVQQVAH
jgi:hypothetical protein